MNYRLYQFTDQRELTERLAERISELLTQAIKRVGRASLAVSGGSTPVALFRKLSSKDIGWHKVVISLVDERWVAPSDRDSNEYLVRQHLLCKGGKAATFVPMKNSQPSAGDGETECEIQLQQVPRPFDVLLLGMGSDGHTASLFPGAKKLANATAMNSGKTCMAIAPPAAAHERMTLTLPAILDAREIILHITGQEKKEVLEMALEEGPLEEMPVRYVLTQGGTPVSVYWAP